MLKMGCWKLGCKDHQTPFYFHPPDCIFFHFHICYVLIVKQIMIYWPCGINNSRYQSQLKRHNLTYRKAFWDLTFPPTSRCCVTSQCAHIAWCIWKKYQNFSHIWKPTFLSVSVCVVRPQHMPFRRYTCIFMLTFDFPRPPAEVPVRIGRCRCSKNLT